MTDDFVRLVAGSNPATRQYQRANTGYPPHENDHSPQNPQAMDPFFDDEDDMPDTAFSRPIPMQSKESGLPLRDAAANPAGHSSVSFGQPTMGHTGLGPGAGQQQEMWSFDDDVHVEQPNPAFPGPGPSSSMQPVKRGKRRRRWKWPWTKDVELKGERIVALNDFDGVINTEFCSNYVSTSKYNMATFLPKFLFGVFSSYLPTRTLN